MATAKEIGFGIVGCGMISEFQADAIGKIPGARVAAFCDVVEEAARARAAFLSRLGEVVLPGPGTVLQEGDVLHVIALEEDLERIAAALSTRAPGGKASKGGR